MHYDCTAAFGLSQGMSDAAGVDQIHCALELRERLPHVWARLQRGELATWRARRIARATIHQPDDIVTWVDTHVAPIAHKVGPITLARIVDEAKMRLHPVERENEQLAHLERRHVKLFDELTPDGVATIEIRADLKDAYDFDQTVGELARIIGALGNTDNLDVRRRSRSGFSPIPTLPQTSCVVTPTPWTDRRSASEFICWCISTPTH